MLALVVFLAVLATATLSGVLGMAGGMVLIALLAVLLPVPAAMVLHGVAQGVSNGSRAFLLRRHVAWSILPRYLLGAVCSIALFAAMALVPDRAVILIGIGALVWFGRLMPQRLKLDIEQPAGALSCGFVVTAAQLLAGASGPLLDLFYVDSRLDRFQIIASKAVTQTLGHLAKIGYYASLGGTIGGDAGTLPWLWLAATVPAAMAGARIGTSILRRISDSAFRRTSNAVILALASLSMATGALDLLRRSTM